MVSSRHPPKRAFAAVPRPLADRSAVVDGPTTHLCRRQHRLI